ncbi:MAG: hypothetical protein R2744_04790 [Bacteroidales bacterium]
MSDFDSTNTDVLYYTVQLMALHNPVDVTFFRNAEVTVLYNADDLFYRYTTEKFLLRRRPISEEKNLSGLDIPKRYS